MSALGTTVQPRRTPVKPAYLENEFTYRIRTTDTGVRDRGLGQEDRGTVHTLPVH